ncbi:MAG: hypothetical protein ACK40G_18475 [Cytophagaceae bacterium]
MSCTGSENIRELYSTPHGSVYQCDRSRSFIVDFAGVKTSFKVACFFSLKKSLESIDVEAMLLNPDPAFDYTIFSPCGCERVYLLSVKQILEFRELLQGAKAMIQLNSIIHEKLRPVFA